MDQMNGSPVMGMPAALSSAGSQPCGKITAMKLSDPDFRGRRYLLRVLEVVLVEPTTCDVGQSIVPKLIPTLFQPELSNCSPECTKSASSVYSIQQLAPDSLGFLRLGKSLHD